MTKLHDNTELPLAPWKGPAILLVDLDAFFASVEQLDHPAWRGRPVIVGGDADKHGVVSTCSYEARAFGVRSAMAASLARELCPDAIWTRGHFSRYREMSNRIMSILRDETPFVQQVSIDEAFIDVSPTRANTEHPVLIADRIARRVEGLGVTCSIGVGSSKSVAKIASDMDKPRGLTVVYPGKEESFLAPLPIRRLSGVGAVAEKSLIAHGVRTLGDLACADTSLLRRVFGKNAEMMRDRARGCDSATIEADAGVKSVSHEVTFSTALDERTDIEAAVRSLASKVGRRLRRKGLKGRTIVLRMRYDDRTTRSSQTKLTRPTDDDLFFAEQLCRLVDDLWRPGMKVRLIGVGISGFEEEACVQEALFDAGETQNVDNTRQRKASALSDECKRRKLIDATDNLKDKFGEGAVIFGCELRNAGNTTGSSSKNPADYK